MTYIRPINDRLDLFWETNFVEKLKTILSIAIYCQPYMFAAAPVQFRRSHLPKNVHDDSSAGL